MHRIYKNTHTSYWLQVQLPLLHPVQNCPLTLNTSTDLPHSTWLYSLLSSPLVSGFSHVPLQHLTLLRQGSSPLQLDPHRKVFLFIRTQSGSYTTFITAGSHFRSHLKTSLFSFPCHINRNSKHFWLTM